MKKLHSFKRILLFLSAFLIAVVLINFCSKTRQNPDIELQQQQVPYKVKTYHSECDCQHDQISLLIYPNLVRVQKANDLIRTFPDFSQLTFTCDVYNTFKRSGGDNSRTNVIAFSLYGSDPKYSKDLKLLAKAVKKLYPGWLMRVYHDRTVSTETKCQLECLKADDTDEYLGNVDLCDITAIPHNDLTSSWNASFMHAMNWRFLPVGDSFVEAFMSRDTDSMVTERERSSVDVWLGSSQPGHIMRDHPFHDVVILGGMWGFYNTRNLLLARQIYSRITNRKIASRYNKIVNKKGQDQVFLGEQVYPLIQTKSVVHDSYMCRKFGGEPFPTRRIGLCHIGQYIFEKNECANSTDIDYYFFKKSPLCPIECRPKDHKDWTNC